MYLAQQENLIYRLLDDIPNKQYKSIQITLNENPFRFDEKGNRVLGEPYFQIVIRARDSTNRSFSTLIYEYMDFPTKEDASKFISKLSINIKSLGFTKIDVA